MRMFMRVESFVLLVITVFSISVFWNGMYLNTGGGITGHVVNEPSNLITGNVVKVANSEPQAQQGGGASAQSGGGTSNSGFSGFSEGVTRNILVGGTVISTMDDNGVTYNHKDRLGSNRVQTDSQGLKVSEFKSLPYGQTVKKSEMRHEFTEKERDESGDYYFGARYYDPDLGKFSSVDPVTDNHAFGYVNNNPMKYIDPTGMYAEDPGAMGSFGPGDNFRSSSLPAGSSGGGGFWNGFTIGIGGFSSGTVNLNNAEISRFSQKSYDSPLSGSTLSLGYSKGDFSISAEGYFNNYEDFSDKIDFDTIPISNSVSADAIGISVTSATSGIGASLSGGYTLPFEKTINVPPIFQPLIGDKITLGKGTKISLTGTYNKINSETGVTAQYELIDPDTGISQGFENLDRSLSNSAFGGTYALSIAYALTSTGGTSLINDLQLASGTWGDPSIRGLNPNVGGITLSQSLGDHLTFSGKANIRSPSGGAPQSWDDFTKLQLNGWQVGLTVSP